MILLQATDRDSLLSLARPHLRELAAYTPIEPFEVLSQRLGRQPADIIKLDANENPYGPPPEVREALAAMPFPNIYPDPETRRLRGALAALHGLPVEHLLVGVLLLLTCMHALNALLPGLRAQHRLACESIPSIQQAHKPCMTLPGMQTITC